MTHTTKRWSYSTGERGRNRVRAFEHPKTGTLFLEFAEGGFSGNGSPWGTVTGKWPR